MKRSKPTHIGDVLAKLKKTTELAKQLEHARIWSRWPELAGRRLCAHGHPRTVKDNTLIIEAESPVWVHRFTLAKWHIVKRINRMAGKELVSDIFVQLEPDKAPSPPQDGG